MSRLCCWWRKIWDDIPQDSKILEALSKLSSLGW